MSSAVTEGRVGGRVRFDRATTLLIVSFGLLATATVAGLPVVPVAGFLAVLAIVAAGHRTLLQWQSLTALLIAIVLFIRSAGTRSRSACRSASSSTGCRWLPCSQPGRLGSLSIAG